jgi:hypothetical protein
METLTATDCLYLYGVIPATASLALPTQGDLISVDYRDLACVTAHVAASEYDVPANASDQLDWLAPRALHHHRTIVELMAATTILPFRFGTTCSDTENVRAMLAGNYDDFRRCLDQVTGKEEWTLSICVDRAASLAHVRATDAAISELHEPASFSTGHSYLLQKKRERGAEEVLRNRLSAMHNDCCNRVCLAVTSVVQAPVHQPDGTGLLPVTSLAVLGTKEQVAGLEKMLAQFEADYADFGAAAHITGPWPPYSFVTNLP